MILLYQWTDRHPIFVLHTPNGALYDLDAVRLVEYFSLAPSVFRCRVEVDGNRCYLLSTRGRTGYWLEAT